MERASLLCQLINRKQSDRRVRSFPRQLLKARLHSYAKKHKTDYCIDWSLREKAQSHLVTFAFSTRKKDKAAKDPYNFEWFQSGRIANMLGGRKKSRIVIHTELSRT